jgi:hypothetical protein
MIGKVILYKFQNDANLFSIFAGRVFPLVGAQAQSTPYAIYEVINNTPSRSKDSDSHIDSVDVRITLISTNYSDTANGIDYVRSAFVRMREIILDVAVQSCKFDGERDLFSDDERYFAKQVDLTFRIIKL